MAGQKLTDRTALTEQLNKDDLLMTVDVSDTTSSADGTSKKIANKFIIQTDKLSLVQADFTSMDDTGVAGTFQTLVSAPGSGYAIIPLNVCIITSLTSAESSNSNLYFSFDSTQTSLYWNFASRWNGSVLTSATFNYGPDGAARGNYPASVENKSFFMYSNANFNGNYSADVYTTYQIIKL
jgi:hypothetical protein|tara:strand:+ start:38 stop:580 length:543 start_codon:yes stop_codon:yes gene_type:complete